MNNLKNLYDKSPVFIQDVMVNVSGAIKAKNRYGKSYHSYRQWLLDYDTWDPDKKRQHQASLLAEFIKFSAENSPFYEKFYSGIDLSEINNPQDLSHLPILDKDTLREELENVYTVPRRYSTEAHTGGTTGKSLVVRYTRDDEMKRMAMLDHFKSRHGFENRKMRRATFSGKHIIPPNKGVERFWRFNRPANQMLYSSFHISEKNLWHYVRNLNEFKPESLDGYFTPLCDLANFIERNELTLDFQPIAIFPTAETTTERGRELLERVFRTRVYDQYASSEGAPFVTECSEGNKHLELATGVIENIPGSNEILVTSFQTHGTPLIRYRIGDSMEVDNSGRSCSCGVSTSTISKIYGRSDDYLLTAEGVKINSVNIASLLKHMPNSVIQAQVRQERLGEVTVLLAVDETRYRSEYDKLLREKFAQSFGNSTVIRVERVREIPREKSGKHRLIKNLMR